MATFTLLPTRYEPQKYPSEYMQDSGPQDRESTYTILSEDDSQLDSPHFPQHMASKAAMFSPTFSDDFPTPKASENTAKPSGRRDPASPASDVSSDYSSWPRKTPEGYFDDLYDITDDESLEVPLKCSRSVKKESESSRNSRNRYPSIIIPSPSAWPTIQKLQKSAKSAASPMKSPFSAMLSPKPGVLSMLAARSLQVPATSATPSLDGSMTSEEMASLSCPSTPDTHLHAEQEDEWLPPPQLHPDALETLHHISYDVHNHESSSLVEMPEAEMQEVQRSTSPINIVVTPVDGEGNDPFSPISIPSPGGFFSSLGAAARNTWCAHAPVEDAVPSTSTAEQFYGVPWDDRADKPVGPEVHITTSPTDNGIPTPRFASSIGGTTLRAGSEEIEVEEIERRHSLYEYKKGYEEKLKQTAIENLDRTAGWLSAQETYLAAILASAPIDDECPPESPHKRKKSTGESIGSPSKKSVRFMEDTNPPKSPTDSEKTITKNNTFVEGFEYLLENIRKIDVFIHRQTRAEYIHLNRRCTGKAHREQLLGKYVINNYVRPSAPRPVSSFYTDEPTILKERIARAQMEQQALQQMRPVVWILQALKTLNGGRLISKPATRTLSRSANARILDVGGEAACAWAWQAAFDYSYATVHTVNTADRMCSLDLEGPANHRVTTVPNLWTFPFPSGHFDVISARSLYSLLKSVRPDGRAMDEYDLCLAECLRCLKPGGYIEFSLLDADILRPGTRAQALSVEFAYNLKTRGYDAAPTKSFIPRLKRAGFTDVKRTWMLLPMGDTAAKWNQNLPVGASSTAEKSIAPDGTVELSQTPTEGNTANAAGITGLVGAWEWEKWLLKLQMERGIDEERALDGVVQVLEEGAREGAAWRYLSGWARKPVA